MDHLSYAVVTGTSHDPDALAAKLNEQATEGFSVQAMSEEDGRLTVIMARYPSYPTAQTSEESASETEETASAGKGKASAAKSKDAKE